MIVGLLRHGRTAWNDAGRLQGRADVPLSPEGRAQVARWQLPPALAGGRIVASPLARAAETARLLAGRAPALDPDLAEMDWGAWEGETFERLRTLHGPAFAAEEARGLDFRPPGGESLREVQRRLLRWLAREAAAGGTVVAVTHRGVLNTLVAHLTAWNGIGRAPLRLRPDCVHVVAVDAAGEVREHAWNVALDAGARDANA
ncbi:MAG: hypothetical protein BroJett026_23640 [Betaproteobacteria bacterium]|nr:MAG: hypothetical protein BroJett026_23640 [Betaproteobacteria bacterium]